MPLRCTVIIPAYNEERTIGECLEALLDQSLPRDEYEVIVVDDGSTDSTPEVVRSFPFTCLSQQNHGPAEARNHGVRHARGEVILFTDADCVPDRHWVEEMLRPFGDPAVAGVKGVYRSRQRGLAPRFAQLEFEDRYDKLASHDSIDFVDSHAAAFRREIFLEVGGFDPHFPVANNEDVDLSYKIAESGRRMIFTQKAIVYHLHPGSVKEYLQLKFLRGYWRMMVYRRFPRKVVSDSYTPQTLKLQIILAGLIWGSLALAPLAPSAWTVFGGSLGLFLATCLGFVVKSLGRDLPAALAAPGFLLGRSTVFLFGVIAGVLSHSKDARLWPTMFLISDGAAVGLAYLLAYEVRVAVLDSMLPSFDYTSAQLAALLPVVLAIWAFSMTSVGLYRAMRSVSSLMEYLQILKGGLLSMAITAALGFFFKFDYSRSFLVLHTLFGIGMLAASRALLRDLERHLLGKGYQSIRVLVLGCGESGLMAARRLHRHPELGYNLVGFVAAEGRPQSDAWEGFPILGDVSRLREIIKAEAIDEVFVALPNLPHEDLLAFMAEYDSEGVTFKVVSDMFEIVTSNTSLASSGDLPVVELRAEEPPLPRRLVKRAFELAAVAAVLPVALPLGALVACIVRRQYPDQPLLQEVEVIGKGGEVITVKIFRDPSIPAVGEIRNGHHHLPAASEGFIARLQRFLHGRGLYHLPLLLLQVFKGEIALIGHRAEFADKLPGYSSWERKRLLTKPGITGLWLVIDPGESDQSGSAHYDVYYLRNQSFLLDVLILLKTVPLFLQGFPRSHDRQNAFDRSALREVGLN